ncbi:hypothetical protein FisN_10Hu274 [Fistulifera solaris]|uniref:Nucleolar protein 12 n=1 Tax=Fistulifera solaris TaxID=1519565 RepID=A0A1Z5JXC4_FISSO|nr:hypothetical protein FisN_10Hu274 [Fistulifera solaris]|eukprot:GAX18526.1 hypothetical protein FisN_10Hu274 [Fistulifera solaris]
MTKTKNNNNKRTFYAKRKTEITFDPESRKDYLQGFSQRKQQRRAFGLAMQKVKDRKAKLEKRAERKDALQEQMEQAEQQKAQVLESLLESQPNEWLKTSLPAKPLAPEPVDTVKLYQDTETKSCWGGEVIVTTSTKMFGEEDSVVDETTHHNKKKKGKDAAQEYAGNVERFMHELKGNLPGKKKKTSSSIIKVKGKHGAAKMKGMGGDLKTAQRILKQAQTKKGRRRSK